eukprot:2068790-Rhodomonas_salina.2
MGGMPMGFPGMPMPNQFPGTMAGPSPMMGGMSGPMGGMPGGGMPVARSALGAGTASSLQLVSEGSLHVFLLRHVCVVNQRASERGSNSLLTSIHTEAELIPTGCLLGCNEEAWHVATVGSSGDRVSCELKAELTRCFMPGECGAYEGALMMYYHCRKAVARKPLQEVTLSPRRPQSEPARWSPPG